MIDDELAATLLDSSPDALFLVDRDGAVMVANRSAAQLFGYAVDSLQEMNIDDLVPIAQRSAHRRLRGGYARDPEPRAMGSRQQLFAERADGVMVPVEISLSPVRIGDVTHTIATVRDVSERQQTRASLALLQDRERIARDLHDMVVQRLFAAGMGLQAVVGTAESPVVLQRINEVVGELDHTIQALRSAVFRLGQPDDERSLSALIAEFVRERSERLGFEPELELSGDIDGLPDHISAQLIATLTEALSNVARHADATEVVVQVTRSVDGVDLRVVDDGVGINAAPKQAGGISNMMWRAAELSGSCTVTAVEPSGTLLQWTVPT